MIPDRRGFIRLSLTILRDALGLPKDMEVHGVALTVDDLFSNTVTLAVSGAPCPEVPAGTMAPSLWVRLQRHSNGRVSVDKIETPDLSQDAAPIAEVVDAPVVWFVGQLRFESMGDLEPSPWEMQGIFSDRDKAVAACRSVDYFIAAVELNAQLPDEKMSVDDVTRSSCFPLVDPPERLESLVVIGRERSE